MIHELKTWPAPFEAIASGEKTHEVRKNDRRFETGDSLLLEEWDPDSRQYTGRVIRARISYISRGGTWGLPSDVDILSIQPQLNPIGLPLVTEEKT